MSRVALYFSPLCKTAPQSFLCTASHYKNNPEYSELLYVLLSLNSANACQPKKKQKNKKSSLTWTEEGKGCQDNLRLRRRQVGVGDRWNGEAWLLYFKDSIFYLFHFPLLSVALCATGRVIYVYCAHIESKALIDKTSGLCSHSMCSITIQGTGLQAHSGFGDTGDDGGYIP